MEFISFAIPFAALVFLTVIVGGLMNYYMDQRGLAFNPYLTYLLLPAIVGALYFVGGVSMWTVKGIVLALILLRASVQDLSERQADEFLWVMLLILALVNYKPSLREETISERNLILLLPSRESTARNMPLQSCLCAGLAVVLFAEPLKAPKARLLTIGDV